jgi:pyruvate dehydrogenase E2 component (dihydrolipoamide acetyltransferase)
MQDVVMPRLSDSMEEGTILQWLVDDGADVQPGQEIVEIESDKATAPYESPGGGTLRIVAQPGDTLPIGAVIAHLGDGAAPAPAAPAQAVEPAAEPAPAPAQSPRVPATDGLARVKASPIARRIAREQALDLAAVTPTGPGGRVVKSDVLAALSAPAPAAAAATPDGPPAVRHRPPTRIERLVAERMVRSRTEIPDFTVSIDIDVTRALAFREELRAVVGPDRRPPSLNDLVVKAAALALREHPRVNSAWTDEGIAEYDSVNIGVAVATDDGGLVVPVIRDADRLPLGRLAQEGFELVTRARAGRAAPADFSGATFTVSNLGMFGVTHFTAIITPGQGAILAVGAAIPNAGAPTTTLTATLSSDHRVIYGAHAAAFLARVRTLLEHPSGLAL